MGRWLGLGVGIAGALTMRDGRIALGIALVVLGYALARRRRAALLAGLAALAVAVAFDVATPGDAKVAPLWVALAAVLVWKRDEFDVSTASRRAVRGGGPSWELAAAAPLVQRVDGDTLDPFLLRRDKRRVFSPDGRAALGFRYVHGVALAASDLVGEPDAFDACVDAFLEECAGLGWRPAVVGARGDRLDVYRRRGLHAVYIGDEAVIDVARFALDGKRMRNARHSVNRSHNFSVTTEIWREGDLPEPLRQDLLAIAATQRGNHREFGF